MVSNLPISSILTSKHESASSTPRETDQCSHWDHAGGNEEIVSRSSPKSFQLT